MSLLVNPAFWSLIISGLGLVCNVVIFFFGRYVYIRLRFNDLTHLQKDVDELKGEIKDTNKNVSTTLTALTKSFGKIANSFAKFKGICSEREKRICRIEELILNKGK